MSVLQNLLQTADSYKEKYGAAYQLMLELAAKPDLIITEDNILELHRLLYQHLNAGQAGKYRTAAVTLPDTGYVPPAPEDLPRLMGHLDNQILSSRSVLHPIELAAMAYKRLVDIHPFDGGNETTALLLMNLILIHCGYGFVSIPAAKRAEYHNALTASRKLNDMEPFSELIAQCVIEAEQERIQKL